MADPHKGLTLEFRKTADGSHYELGTMVEGAWFTFGAESAPNADAKIAAAKQAAADAKPTRATK